MTSNLSLSFQPFEKLANLHTTVMKDSTQRFIESMRHRYGPEEKAGRGNILNFGEQISVAIGNSKMLKNGQYFFAVQTDFRNSKFQKHLSSPLGIYAALICGNEETVVMLPHSLLSDVMKDSPTDRFNIVLRDHSYYLRVTGHPLLDVTAYVNKYPEPEAKLEVSVEQTRDTFETTEQQLSEINEHTRIQWMLIKFGQAADYLVWVPMSDRSKEFNSEKLADLTVPELPNFGFDAITKQIISNIDVLWLEDNVIQKAFEIESTTSIFSGLLRMSDLVLSQPNINIDLHLVAPIRRRELVRKNVLRPTFARLRSKCSYISFEEVITKYELVKDILKKQKAKIRDLLESETF